MDVVVAKFIAFSGSPYPVQSLFSSLKYLSYCQKVIRKCYSANTAKSWTGLAFGLEISWQLARDELATQDCHHHSYSTYPKTDHNLLNLSALVSSSCACLAL